MTVILLLICQKCVHAHTDIHKRPQQLAEIHLSSHDNDIIKAGVWTWIRAQSLLGVQGLQRRVRKQIFFPNALPLAFFIFSPFSSSLCRSFPLPCQCTRGNRIFYCTGRALSVPHEGRLEVEFPLPFRQLQDGLSRHTQAMKRRPADTAWLLTQPSLVVLNLICHLSTMTTCWLWCY